MVPALGLTARNCSHTGYGRLNWLAGHEEHLRVHLGFLNLCWM